MAPMIGEIYIVNQSIFICVSHEYDDFFMSPTMDSRALEYLPADVKNMRFNIYIDANNNNGIHTIGTWDTI